MNQSQFKKIARLLKGAYAELEQEAVGEGIAITSPEYEKAVAAIREALLEREGFTLEEYRDAKASYLSDSQKSTDVAAIFDKITLVEGKPGADAVTPSEEYLLSLIKPLIPAPIPGDDGNTPTKEEVLALIRPLIPTPKDGETPSDSRLLALIDSLMPDVRGMIDSNVGYLENKISAVEEKIPSPVDLVRFKTEIVSETSNFVHDYFSENFKKNIDVLGMPDFRKLAMGLRGEIDAMQIKEGVIFNGGTAGSVLFIGSNGAVAQDNANFNYALATATLGLGTTASATQKFTITDTVLAGSGSLAGSAMVINQTWNTTGAPTAFKVNVTNTASNAGLSQSKLFDFQVGGASKFYFDVNAGAFYFATGLYRNTNNNDLFSDNNVNALAIYSTGATTTNTSATNANPRFIIRTGSVVTWAPNSATNTATFSNMLVEGILNPGASNVGGTFYGTRINPTITGTTGLTGAYLFGVSASSVDKFQVTSTGLVNCLIDGNSLQVGSGSNAAVYAGFAAQRGFYGYDGASMLLQGGTGKAVAISVNNNTFGSGTPKIMVASTALRVGLGGIITNGATAAGAMLILDDTIASGTLVASTENILANFVLSLSLVFPTGALATQRAMLIQAPTYAFVGASTITNATTLEISGAPVAGTNATITTALAFRVAAGNSAFAGSVLMTGATSVVRLKGYTVATLPAGTQGDTAFVTDALAPAFLTAVVGGGAVVSTVFHNGTNWVAQ